MDSSTAIPPAAPTLTTPNPPAAFKPATPSAKTLTTVIYVLYGVSVLAGVTAIVALIINYLKKSEVADTFLASHFRWQIRTFWFALLWFVVGLATFWFVIGWFICIANAVWFIYRIVKGWLRLNDDQAMYQV